MAKPPKLLILEDYPSFIEAMRRVFERTCFKDGLLIAETIEEARHIVTANPDLAFITIDGRVPERVGERPIYSLDFVRWLRKSNYRGCAIAVSSDDELNKRLVEAGCDFAWPKSKLFGLTTYLEELVAVGK
jgi:response regulator of citrate/malate metabolism